MYLLYRLLPEDPQTMVMARMVVLKIRWQDVKYRARRHKPIVETQHRE